LSRASLSWVESSGKRSGGYSSTTARSGIDASARPGNSADVLALADEVIE
jgi:hypothetical protein